MAQRKVERSGKGAQGDITRLCGPWGAAPKDDAIEHIELRLHSYYVEQPETVKAQVLVVRGSDGKKHLAVAPEADEANQLTSLPDC